MLDCFTNIGRITSYRFCVSMSRRKIAYFLFRFLRTFRYLDKECLTSSISTYYTLSPFLFMENSLGYADNSTALFLYQHAILKELMAGCENLLI